MFGTVKFRRKADIWRLLFGYLNFIENSNIILIIIFVFNYNC